MKAIVFSLAVYSALVLCAPDINIHVDLDIKTETLSQPRRGKSNVKETNDGHEQAHTGDKESENYILEFGHGKHQGFPSDDGSYIKWSNIPYAIPPHFEETRWFRPLTWLEYEEGVIHNGTGIKKCPQAQPGWVYKAAEFLGDFATTQDGSKNLKPLPAKWDTPITPNDYVDPSNGSYAGSEDCLYLDVYVPIDVYQDRGKRQIFHAATTVWIHGGGFVAGSKDDIKSADGLFKASNKTDDLPGFILVSINYRLGMFGWMGGMKYLNEYGTVNLGLEDQRAAIEWVSNNIWQFGGDKNRVSLMGESAGASSILHHLTYEQGNPRADNPRYKNVIMQSPAFFPQPDTEPLDKVYNDVLSRANVKDLEALGGVSNETLKKINYEIIFRSPYGQFTFGPTINSSATPDLPGKLIKQGKYHKNIAVLSGYTKLDGLLFTPPWIRNEQAMVDYVSSIYPKSAKAVNDTIKSYTFVKGDKDGLSQRLAIMSVSNVLDDLAIQCNVNYLAEQQVNSDQTYGKIAYMYQFGAPPAPLHGADLDYLFYPEDAMPGMGPANPELAERFQKYWANFIRYLDPNDEEDVEKEKPVWTTYTKDNRKAMVFGHFLDGVLGYKNDYNFKLESDPLNANQRQRCSFWQDAPYAGGVSVKSRKFVDQTQGHVEIYEL